MLMASLIYLHGEVASQAEPPFVALAVFFIIGTFLLFRRLTASPASIVILSAMVSIVRSGHGRETGWGMQRLWRVFSTYQKVGPDRRSLSRCEWRTTTLPNAAFPFPAPHSSFTYRGYVFRSIWTDIVSFEDIPRTKSITPCARLLFVFDARCRAHTRITRSFHPFQGTSSPPPSDVPIESGVSERWEMAASGSVAWTASLNKRNASSTHPVCLYPLHAAVVDQC